MGNDCQASFYSEMNKINVDKSVVRKQNNFPKLINHLINIIVHATAASIHVIRN